MAAYLSHGAGCLDLAPGAQQDRSRSQSRQIAVATVPVPLLLLAPGAADGYGVSQHLQLLLPQPPGRDCPHRHSPDGTRRHSG